MCVSVWISDTKQQRKTKGKGKRPKETGIDVVHFNMTPRQKLLAGQLGSEGGAGRDAWAVPTETPLCRGPKSNQLSGREPLCLPRGSGPIRCPGWLLAELQLFAITAAA